MKMKKNYKARNKTATSFENDIIYKTFSFEKNNQMFHRDYRFGFLILFITRSFRTPLKDWHLRKTHGQTKIT